MFRSKSESFNARLEHRGTECSQFVGEELLQWLVKLCGKFYCGRELNL